MTGTQKKIHMYNPDSVMHRNKVIRSAIRIICVTLTMIIVLAPFYTALTYAFRDKTEVPVNRLAFSQNPTLVNFHQVLYENELFPIGFKNSVFYTIPCVILLMTITAMSSWVLARNETTAYNILYAILSLGLLAPFQCFELPLYINWHNWGLTNSGLGFVLARAGLQISISLVAVTGFVKTVPRELEQAAGIDGCNRFQMFWKVVFPLMTPINVTQLVLNTLFIWNDFTTAIVLLRNREVYTVTLAQIEYFNGKTTELNEAFAFFILAMIPILVLYLVCQKYIISGITAGAVKG